MKCWAEAYCKGYPAKCADTCVGYVQLATIYALSNMPRRYQYGITLTSPGQDRDAYLLLKDWQESVVHHVYSGHGLFIFSPLKGNGKTSWACKIMNDYFRRVALTNDMRCRGLFVNVPEFLRDLKDGFNDSEKARAMHEFQENIRSADLVIWDDIGTETPTNWVRETLYTFINRREANAQSQIFTSNLNLETLQQDQYLGERIVSRIVGSCQLIEFVERDRRLDGW